MSDAALNTAKITPLPTAMTAAAFTGIAWYLCAELNVRLLIRATHRSLYFWACLICSWGIIAHLLFILLLDFKILEGYGVIVLIHFMWCIYVVSQSIVLFSRLNLVLKSKAVRKYVLYMVIFTAIVFGLGTVIVGCVARYPSNIAKLGTANLIWDKVELGAFFIQETAIALLYIRETALHLKNMTLLGTDRKTTRRVLQQLIWVNVFIICLDCSLIGLCYAGFFFLQGYYKAAIYAVKLRTEFTILNQLRSTLPGQSGHGSGYGGAYAITGNRQTPKVKENAARRGSQDSDVEMVTMTTQNREIRVQKDIVVSSSEKDGRSDYSVTRS